MADANPIPYRLRVCKTCRFYLRQSGDEKPIERDDRGFWDYGFGDGRCHRYPPKQAYALPSYFSDEHPDGLGDASDASAYFDYTPVSVYDWCGEWQLREGLVLPRTDEQQAPPPQAKQPSEARPLQTFWARPTGSKLVHAWHGSPAMSCWCGTVRGKLDPSRLIAGESDRRTCSRCLDAAEAYGFTPAQP